MTKRVLGSQELSAETLKVELKFELLSRSAARTDLFNKLSVLLHVKGSVQDALLSLFLR